MITWFAGLFYIFRLFVYHVEQKDKPEVVAVLETMQRRLYYAITWPSLALVIFFGVILLFKNPTLLKMGWIQIKLFFILFLLAYHFYAGHIRKCFVQKNFKLSSKQCRLINEVPTLILLIVVPLAIMKPF